MMPSPKPPWTGVERRGRKCKHASWADATRAAVGAGGIGWGCLLWPICCSFVVVLLDATYFGENLLKLSAEAKDVVEVVYFPLLLLLYYLGFF